MTIACYISELLYDYECVIVPGFGGFITNSKPATINIVNHKFNPPYSQIFFNVHLTSNDGLLLNHIVKRNNQSYSNVRQFVDQFVAECIAKLESGGKVHLENIGTLEFDEKKNIRFEQLTSVNYNPNAFGLKSFTSPAIKRQSDEEKLKGFILPEKRPASKAADRKQKVEKEHKTRGFVRSPLLIVMAAILIFSLSWAMMNRDDVVNYLGEQASVFSFHQPEMQYQPRTIATPNEEFEELLDKKSSENLDAVIPAENEKVIEERTNQDVYISENNEVEEYNTETKEEYIAEAEAINKPEITVAKENMIVPVVKPSGKQYYIIAGSFSMEKNAGKLVTQLRNKGFGAFIADTTNNGMYRVAYLVVESLTIAKEQLYAIRQEDNVDAWILRK